MKYKENEDAGIPNQLTIQDIQGASGAVFIAGSNTVSSHPLMYVHVNLPLTLDLRDNDCCHLKHDAQSRDFPEGKRRD